MCMWKGERERHCAVSLDVGEDGGNALRCSLGWCVAGIRFAVPAADRKRSASLSLAHRDYASTAEKPPTGRFFWTLRIGSLLGGFSLTKAPSFAIRISDCKIHPQRRLNDTGVSSSAELDQQALPAGHLPPFEKGGRKLLFCKLGAAR